MSAYLRTGTRREVAGLRVRGAIGWLVREYVGMGDTDTARDIEQASQDFETRVTEPDPNNARRTQRKVGSVTAWKKGTHIVAGGLSFGVTEDENGNLNVRTTQFSTQPGFEGKHVALLLAYARLRWACQLS